MASPIASSRVDSWLAGSSRWSECVRRRSRYRVRLYRAPRVFPRTARPGTGCGGEELEEVVAGVVADPARVNRWRMRRVGLTDPAVDAAGAVEWTIGEVSRACHWLQRRRCL